MFGHQTLRIPLHGRHGKHVPIKRSQRQEASRWQKINTSTPEASLVGPSESSKSCFREKRPLTSAMNLLRGYYGLSSPAQHSPCLAEGMELTSYRSEGEDFSEEEPLSPLTPPASKNDKSVLNGKPSANASTEKVISRLSHEYTPESVSIPSFGVGDIDKGSEQSVRRRSKVDGMSPLISASEIESKQDADPPDKLQSSYGLPIVADSIGSRTAGFLKVLDGALAGGKSKDEPISKVIKSMSTSNLQDQIDSQANSSGTKSANQVQSTSRSLFEGLSKPAFPRYKEALD